VAHDDWRLRIELGEHAAGFLERLARGLTSDAAVLADELEDHRLAATHEDGVVYVYADSALQAERARRVVEAELVDDHMEARSIRLQHWLPDEDRWDDEPPQPTVDEEVAAKGYAPWEVHVERESHREAEKLADQLEGEGHPVVRRWRYLIVGASSEEEARALARRLHGDVEAGGEVVWETTNSGPFAIFRAAGESWF
jgi:hypothetical protein